MSRRRVTVLVVVVLLSVLLGASRAASPATMTFIFSDNAENDFAVRGWLDAGSLFQRNFRAAGQQWGDLIGSPANFTVHVIADRTRPRFGGGTTLGRQVGVSAGGLSIWEFGPLTKILTGANPGAAFGDGFDMSVHVNSLFLDQFYWLDTNPETRGDPVPRGRTDLVSIVMHELGHSLGFAPARSQVRDATYGLLTRGFENVYDSWTSFGGDGSWRDAAGMPNPMFFNGPESTMVYGAGPVPLTNVPLSDPRSSQNFAHLGQCGDPDILSKSLMNGCSVPTDGTRMEITEVDVAVLADVGYPLNAIYFPTSGQLHFAVKVGATMFGVRIHTNRPDGLLELAGVSASARASSDVSYDAATGTLRLPALVVAGEADHAVYSIDLRIVSSDPILFTLSRADVASPGAR